MRFGATAMQLHSLLPAGITPQQAMMFIMTLDHADLVRHINEYDIDLVELTADMAMFLPHTFSEAAIKKLAALKHELDIDYTVHLPFYSLELATPQAHIRQGSVQTILDTIRAAEPLEPQMYVLHATGAFAAEFSRMVTNEMARAVLLNQFKDQARSSIEAIIEQSGIEHQQLAVENVEFPFDLTLELATVCGTSFCFDTGHLLAGKSGDFDLFEALEQALPVLGEVHLHDSPHTSPDAAAYGKDHQALGRGDLDTARFLGRLQAAAWEGPIILEMELNAVRESMTLIRSLAVSGVNGSRR